MAVYNNRYYPDTRNSTWSDISTLSWSDSDLDWSNFNANIGNASVSWSYTTNATDLGSSKWFYPVTQVLWDDSEPVTIQYEYSNDDSTYTTANAEPMYGRYVKTKITTDGAYLTSIQTFIETEPVVETYYNLNTSTLSGNVDYRTLSTASFSQVQSVTITPSITETKPVQGRLVSNNTDSITIRIVDLDTWDKVSINANVNIVVVGFPKLTANSTTGTVSVTG
jgi:hypothetical protein